MPATDGWNWLAAGSVQRVIWVFGAGAAVLIATLAVLGWLTLRRWRARRALERSFQREWFGLARWATLASADEEPPPEPPVEEPWYVEGDQRPLSDLAAVAPPEPDPSPVETPEMPALDLEAPWPPSSHEDWVAVLTDAEGAGPPIDRSAKPEPQQAEVRPPPTAAAAPAAGPIDSGPVEPAKSGPAEGEVTADPPESEPTESGPKYGSPEALASLASNLAPVPEYAPLAAELASFAAELAAMINDRDTLEAGDTAQ